MDKASTPKHRLRSALSILLAMVLIMGLLPQLTQTAEAAPSGSGYLTVGSSIRYDSYETHYMYVDGNVAYCAEPNKATPPAGTYTKEPCTTHRSPYSGAIHEVQEIYAILYFGYGGPGFDPSMWPAYYNGGSWTPELYQAMTHVFLSGVFAYNADAALYGCSAGFKSWAWKNIIGWDQENQQSVYSSWGWHVYERRWEVPQAFCDSCFQMTTGSNTQVIVSFVPGGYLDLQKASGNTDITDGHPCYSLEGAEYGVYADAGCSSKVATLTTNSDGYARSDLLSTGTVYVKETKAPKGYALDEKVYPTAVGSGTTTRVNEDKVYDMPQNDPAAMWVGKIDLETTLNMPQGSASLAGAEFTVRYYNDLYDSVSDAQASGDPTRTWVVRTDEHGFAELADDLKVRGDAFYYGSSGFVTIPIGTVLIQETKAPKGYYLTDNTVYLRKVSPSGDMESVTTFNPPTVKEQVYRGDFEFTKARENTQERLANVPFKITSLGTGESHIIVTDVNGEAKTASSWNAHTSKTNANDAALRADGTIDESKLDPYAGIWFYGANGNATAEANNPPNNAKGALAYGTYLLEELLCSANAGLTMISVPVSIERDGYAVNFGTLDNQTPGDGGPSITTVARNAAGGGKSANADTATKLVDRVSYANLPADEGKAYELHATLMDAETQEPVYDADGNAVTGTARFVPTEKSGYVEVELAFDSRAYANRDVVFFEELMQADGTAPLCEHKDFGDYDQTIRIVGQTLKTKATDFYDGDQMIASDTEAKIADTVTYRNLVAGVEYTLEGTLMINTTSSSEDDEMSLVAAIPFTDAEGNPYTATTTFTPEYADGEATVTFTCDTREVQNRSIVVFERLYRDGELIASHEDAHDADQTVGVQAPVISTTAKDAADGDDVIAADRGARVIDTVAYEGLIAGKEYTLEAHLMVKRHDEEGRVTTAEPLLDADGNEVVASATFTPEAHKGETDVEIPFDAAELDGRELVVYEYLQRDGTQIASHEDPADDGQSFTIRAQSVATELTCARAHGKDVSADSEAELADQVAYSDAVIGASYTAYGILMDPETGLPVMQYSEDGEADEAALEELTVGLAHALGAVGEDADTADMLRFWKSLSPYPHPVDAAAAGNLIEGSDLAERLIWTKQAFTAEGTYGLLDLTYAGDCRGLEGTKATSCVLIVRDDPYEATSSEIDLEREEQTVSFVAPEIATVATDKTDGDKNLLVSTDAVIADEVTYKGLIPGKEYKLEGILYDKATGKPLKVADKEITATKTFTANAAEGAVTVEFALDASGLNGHEVVVYEYLHRVMVTDGDKGEEVMVAEHADIESASQTVGIGHTPGTGYDKTGDIFAILGGAIAGLLIAAGAAIGYVSWTRRKAAAGADGSEANEPGNDTQD